MAEKEKDSDKPENSDDTNFLNSNSEKGTPLAKIPRIAAADSEVTEDTTSPDVEPKPASTSSNENKKTNEDEQMFQALLCSICCEIMHDCIALQPCGHSYCAGCFSNWMSRSEHCPECRLKVKRVAKNRRMNNLIEIFLQTHPDKARPAEDLRELDEKNKINADIFTLPKPDASLSSEESDLSDTDSESNLGIPRRHASARRTSAGCGRGCGLRTPCTSNANDGTVHYSPMQIPVCVQCANFGLAPYQQASSLILPHSRTPPPFVCASGQSHLICQCCGTFMPDRRNEANCSLECIVCKKSFCHLYLGCSRYGCNGCLNKFKDMNFDEALFNNIVNENYFESDILKKHLSEQNLTWANLQADCLAKMDDNTFDCRDKRAFSLTAESILCIHCALANFRDLAYEYRKTIPVNSTIACRPNCWYGRNCRTQKSKLSHAAKLNHICEQTRF